MESAAAVHYWKKKGLAVGRATKGKPRQFDLAGLLESSLP